MMKVETIPDIKTASINEVNKNSDPDEWNESIKSDEETKEKTEHLDKMTENRNNSLKSFNCGSKTMLDNDKDIENQNYTEQRLEKGKIEIENEQKNKFDSVNNLFLTELEKRISKINTEPSDDKYITPVESHKSHDTSSTSSENYNKEIKHGEETEIIEVEGREDETYSYQRKIEPVVNRTMSDIMINTIESGKETKTRIDETEERMEEHCSAIERRHTLGDIGIEQVHKEHLTCVEMKQEHNNTEYIAEQRTNTTKTEQIEEYSQYLESNLGNGNINQISMNSRTSETVKSGCNDTIHMIEINKHLTKDGFINKTVVTNTVVMAQSNKNCKETDQNDDTVDSDRYSHSEINDINNDTVGKRRVLRSEDNDINDDTAMGENVLRSEVKATKDNESTTTKIKDVRFSLPDVLVNMEDMRPTQRSLSLEDLVVKDETKAVDTEKSVKINDIDMGVNNELLDKNTITGRNGDRNGFNELLKGFYKTRDLIRREMSYTKEWNQEEQPVNDETCENPNIILEVSELDTESKEPNNANSNANTNTVTITSVMLDDEDLTEKQNVSSAFAANEKVSTFYEENQALSFEFAKNEIVSVAESGEGLLARSEDVQIAEYDNRPTAFSENSFVFTKKETQAWSANYQNEIGSSVNVEKDENMTLLTKKTLIGDGEKSFVNCISVKTDTTHSNMDREQGQHDVVESLVPDPIVSAKSFLNKGTQTESDLDRFNTKPVFEQKFSANRSNLILSKTNTDITNIKGKSLQPLPYQHVGLKTKGNQNVHDWFHRNDTTQLSTLTLRGHYPDMSYIDEPYYINRSWQRENNDISIPYYPFFDGEISRNSYGIDTKSLSRKIYLPTASERYKKLNSRSSWANSKSTWVKRLYTNPNHNRYLSRRYHGKYDYRKPETYYAGSVDYDYQQRPDRYLLASPGFITIIPEVEKSDGCFQRNKCIWPLLAVISALLIVILVSIIVMILIL